MAHEVVMPQMGLSMDSGTIIAWLKRSGDRIQVGDILFEVESDKATVEVEAIESGVLKVLMGPEDGAIPVGTVVGYLLAQGEQTPLSGPQAAPAAASVPMPAPRAGGAEPQTGVAPKEWTTERRPPSSPAARRRAQELGVDWREATGTGRHGEIKEHDVMRLAAQLEGPLPAEEEPEVAPPAAQVSPVARRLADAVGFDADALARSTAGRRVERADVERAIREALAALPGKAAPTAAVRPEPRRRPISRMRRLIGERMAGSAHTTAPVTLVTEVDATELVHVRESIKASPDADVVPSYNALLAKLVAQALGEHPELNASLDGDEIVTWQTVDIAIAVDTERGLLVPVVRDVQAKPVRELAREMDDLLARAKDGKATPDELTGSTFTITNLGVYDIDTFTPIINPPECAILGVGRLVEKMVVRDGGPAVRTMLALSLTFDHRLVDGAPAARFLQRVKQLVETPYLWLT